MWEYILCITIGFAFGAMFIIERQQNREYKTLSQVDAEIRQQLDFYKNLCNSLKDDVAYLRKKLAALKGDLS